MNYKYIEQLLENYWECATTLEEEQILRSFFSQRELPAHLAPFAPLFVLQNGARAERMPDGFDLRMEAALAAEQTQAQTVTAKARPLSLRTRLAPLLKAAAMVAVVLTIGGAAERAIVGAHSGDEGTDAPVVTDTYVRGSDVAAVVSPTEKKNEATALAADSIVLPPVANELPAAVE